MVLFLREKDNVCEQICRNRALYVKNTQVL